MRLSLSILTILTGALTVLAACTPITPPERYIMRPLAPDAGSVSTRAAGQVVVVAPVRLPDYLDHTEMVTPTGPARLDYDSARIWAEPPSDTIRRVVALDLQQMMPSALILDRAPTAEVPGQITVMLDLADFTLAANGSAMVSGRWSLLGADGRISRSQTFSLATPADNVGREAEVTAMNRTLQKLAGLLSQALGVDGM